LNTVDYIVIIFAIIVYFVVIMISPRTAW